MSSSPIQMSLFPEQLPLFPESIALVRVNPGKNERRFYRLEVMVDLFGRASLLRQWGRMGCSACHKLDLYADLGQAVNALARLVRNKRRRGYVENGVKLSLL
jgi:predicted DNA-binding WGR domain protein